MKQQLRHPDLLLDEYVRRLEPMPWHRPSIPSLTLQRQYELVMSLVERRHLRYVGVARKAWEDGERHTDVLYGPTPEGLAYWEEHIKGRRREPAGMAPMPKYRESQLVAAANPCTVFDLARAPWRHKLWRDLDE